MIRHCLKENFCTLFGSKLILIVKQFATEVNPKSVLHSDRVKNIFLRWSNAKQVGVMQQCAGFNLGDKMNSMACRSSANHKVNKVLLHSYSCVSQRRAWPRKAARCRLPSRMMASSEDKGGSFNPFRNRKKEVRTLNPTKWCELTFPEKQTFLGVESSAGCGQEGAPGHVQGEAGHAGSL